ncbi:MAG: DUF530 family protein [Candidatus Micrarchaeia archaeon]
MSDSLILTQEANDYLDSLEPSMQNAKKRIDKLNSYKAQMIIAGFDAPFRTLVAKAREDLQENSADEAADQRKHTKQIRYIASLKKFTLNRVRVAVAAHRLVQALEDANLAFLAKYLPLNGSYRKILTDSGENAAEAYHGLISIFEQKRYPIRTASALISLMQDGVEIERTIQVDANKNAKETIEKSFGKKAKVLEVRLSRKSAGLIKNYSTKVAIFSMAAAYASAHAAKELEAEEKENANLREYNNILRKNKLVPDSIISEAERFEDIKKQMQHAGFINKIGLDWVMHDEFYALLHRRKNQAKKIALQESEKIVYRLLQWYYVTMNKEMRMSYGAMPSVLANPDEAHLALLEDIAPKGYNLAHPAKVIAQKIAMEENAPPISSRAWGPAFLCVRASVSTQWAAKELNVDESEIKNAIPIIEGLAQGSHSRGAKFLEGLKK